MTRPRLLAVVAFLLAAGVVPLLLDAFLVSLALSCLMYVALAVSWAIFSGATRYISLGTSAFFGLGAYVSAWGLASLPWPLVILGGALLAGGFAALAGSAILHLRGTYFAVLTFGMGELVRHAITYGEKQYAGTVGRVLTAIAFSLLAEFLRLQLPYVYLMLLGAVLIVAVLYLPQGLAGLWSGRAIPSWRRAPSP
jgi:branched-chain amino acid transport system permease protein